MNTTRASFRGISLVCLSLLTLALAACGGKTTAPKVASNPLEGASTQRLAYGISLKVPQGWTIINATRENQPSKAELQKAVQAGQRIEMLNMQRNNAKGEMIAQAYAFLVNSSRDFMPEEAASKASDQDFVRLGDAIMQNARETAAKEKVENTMAEWIVSRSQIGGFMAIAQSGLGNPPEGGSMRVLNYDIYLPKNTGFMLKLKGHVEEPGVEETLRAIVQSVEFTQ